MYPRRTGLLLAGIAVIAGLAIAITLIEDPSWWDVPFVLGAGLIGGAIYWLYKEGT